LPGFDGLGNLAQIGGYIAIMRNPSLTNLDGISNINLGELTDLYAMFNPYLGSCAIPCVCFLIDKSPEDVTLNQNLFGCNTIEEVDSACGDLSVPDKTTTTGLLVYPDPASTSITIKMPFSRPIKSSSLVIINMNSQQVLSHQITDTVTNIDISGFPKGIYFVRITTEKGVLVGKFIKH
jgi:hypothetical protein